MTAIRAGSTSARASIASATGVSTASQSGRRTSPCSSSAAWRPGPSNVIQFQPRACAAALAYAQVCDVASRPPWSITTSGRRPRAGLEEIARERAALVREREPLAAEQFDRALPARALAAPERGLGDRAVGLGDQRQRRRVVRGGMQVAAGARPPVRRAPGSAAGCGPFAQPRVGIAVLHASGGREDLAQVCGSSGSGRQQSP